MSACKVHSTHAASACSVSTGTQNVHDLFVVCTSFWSVRALGLKGCAQSTKHADDSETPQSGCSNLFYNMETTYKLICSKDKHLQIILARGSLYVEPQSNVP